MAPTQTVDRLCDLCKLWGMVKYFHPYLAYRDIDWDRALVETIPRVKAATSRSEFRAAIDHLFSCLADPNTRTVDAAQDDPAEPAAREEREQPFLVQTQDGIGVITATDQRRLGASSRIFEAFGAIRKEGANVGAWVFDLRRHRFDRAPPEGLSPWHFSSRFSFVLSGFLQADVPVATYRHRMHSGHPPEQEMLGNIYSSALVIDEARTIRGTADSETQKPMVFLVDEGTWVDWAVLSGLQTAGHALVIHEGDVRCEQGIQPYEIEVSDGVRAQVRTVEMVNPDGSLGFRPDLVVPLAPVQTESVDPTLEAALRILRGASSAPAHDRMIAGPYLQMRRENRYEEMEFPSEEYRLLALFKLWSVIHYFFAYHHLLDRPWDQALPEFIPRFEAAGDAIAYALVVAEMVTRMQDTHGFVQSSVLQRHLGSHYPQVAVRIVQGDVVVTAVSEDASSSGLLVGDVLLSVDGEDMAERRARLAPLLAASTPQALQFRVEQELLSGSETSEAVLVVRDSLDRIKELRIARTRPGWYVPWAEEQPDPPFRVLDQGFGYIDLRRLTIPGVDEAMEAVKETPGIIFDMRGYPKGTAWSIAPRLTREEVVGAQFLQPVLHSPDPSHRWTLHMLQRVQPSAGNRYEGKIVVLIDASAISQAEHTCLFIEAATDATFVGGPTSGANGNISNTVLPGSILVNFTGLDTRHGDGRQLQRTGVQPHIHVEPTLDGIRAGRDEVLDAAITFLSNELPRSP